MKSLTLMSLALATCVLVGCNSAVTEGRVKVHKVTGTVKMHGAALAQATVAFAPQGEQPTAIGTTDDQGNFQLTTYDFGDGAAEGNYKVVISKSAVAASSSTGGGEHAEESTAHDASGGSATSQNLVPPQYSSATQTPLTAEVKPGDDNTFEFNIE